MASNSVMKRQSPLPLGFSLGLLLLSVLVPGLVEYYAHWSFSHLFWSSIYYVLHRQCITKGSLTIIDSSTQLDRPIKYHFGNIDGDSPLPEATIFIDSHEMFVNALMKGDIGLGESYVERLWHTDTTDDLENYLRVLFINWNNFQYYLSIIDWFSLPMWKEFARLYSYTHTLEQDQESIEFHYDTGIALFELFLDPKTMVYTSAMFSGSMFNGTGYDSIDTMSDWDTQELLTLGQNNKIRQLIQKSNILGSNECGADETLKILDIGCGFGHLASSVSKALQANDVASDVYGITLSKDQLSYARSKYLKQSENLNYVLSDYREFMGNESNVFDGIFSVEMVEAIGRAQLETYFEVVSRLLKPEKRFVTQFIGYNSFAFPQQYKTKEVAPTFVTKYIFPSGFIPNPDEIIQTASHMGLELIHSESFGKNYALTLHLWRKRLYYNKEMIVELYGENTFYTFDYYLGWCEALYNTDIINNWHFVFVKRNDANGKAYDFGKPSQDIIDVLYDF